jgi:hypothetical protein
MREWWTASQRSSDAEPAVDTFLSDNARAGTAPAAIGFPFQLHEHLLVAFAPQDTGAFYPISHKGGMVVFSWPQGPHF